MRKREREACVRLPAAATSDQEPEWPEANVVEILFALVIPVLVVSALVVPARSRRWAADHPIAARRFGLAGGSLGLVVAAFWAGRFVGWW